VGGMLSRSETHRVSGQGTIVCFILRALIAALWIIFFGACSFANAQAKPGSLANVLGANHIDLVTQYLGTASSGDGSPAAQFVTHAMGVKAIQDAANYSFGYMRVAISGYNPSFSVQVSNPAQNDLYLWQTKPTAYWAAIDQMFADLDAKGIKIVAVLDFNWTQFPALANETVRDLIANPSSSSRSLLRTYISQFIQRYKSRKTILFYELSNELNLGADLDNVSSCLASSGAATYLCAQTGNFSSAELLAYSYDIVQFVKSLDANREISSGFSLPRDCAYHLAAQPGWSTQGPDWTGDTPSQFAHFLNYMNRPFDITSVHIYAGDVRFGRPAGTEWETLDAAVTAAHQDGKRVYLGEFADNINNGVSPFITTMVQKLSQLRVDYASPWAFEFYQFATYLSANYQSEDPTSLEPGVTDAILQTYSMVATKPYAQFEAQALSASTNSRSVPQVVLTWPWACASASGSVTAYAVASSPGGIARVDFAVDGVRVTSSSQAPFSANIALTSAGTVTISATAYSASGLSASYSTQVVANGSTASCQAPSTSYQGAGSGALASAATAIPQASYTAASITAVKVSTSSAASLSDASKVMPSANSDSAGPRTFASTAATILQAPDTAPSESSVRASASPAASLSHASRTALSTNPESAGPAPPASNETPIPQAPNSTTSESTAAANTSSGLAPSNSGDALHLVVTCAAGSQAAAVYVVASSLDGLERVNYTVNGVEVASSSQAPFPETLALTSAGATTITATTYSSAGLSGIFSRRVASASCETSSAL
jgi:Bacterial Ig domain/Cellulase (glycosyl hydrolase family 5)